MTIPIAVVTVFAAICAATMVIVYTGKARTGVLDIDPAAAFTDAPAVDLRYTYTALDGTTSTGQFIVTDDGYATGTVSDQFAGAATVHTTPEASAVWGDEHWWARRTPVQAGLVNDQWVQPDPGTALPVDMAAEFNPDALAELVTSINDFGTVDAAVTTYQGIPVVALTWQDWRLLRTSALPTRTLALSGPITSDLFHTAAAPETTVTAVPAVWSGDDHTVGQAQYGSGGTGTLDIDVLPPPSKEVADYAKAQADKTLKGENANPTATTDPEATSAPAEAAPPPAMPEALGVPAFTASINSSTCRTPTCSVSTTVTNIGTAAGSAQSTTTVSPGLGPTTHNHGVLQPGASSTTPSYSFPNPAPTPRPGQTTSGTAMVSVMVYSPEVGGSNADRYRSLINKMGDVAMQAAVDQMLAGLDQFLKDAAVEAMHDMVDADVPAEDALNAMEAATEADPAQGEYSEMPLVRRLTDAGPRFTSWPQIAPMLAGLTPAEFSPYLPGIDAAVQELDNPAAPTVALTYPEPTSATQPQPAVVVSTYPDTEATKCIGVTSTPDGDLAASVDQAVSLGASAAGGCTVTADVTLPDELPLSNADPLTVQRAVQDALSTMQACNGGSPSFTELTVTTGTGTLTWPAAALCATTDAEREQTEVAVLNELALNPALVTELVDLGLVTVTDGHITDINKREDDPACKSEYKPGPTSSLEQGSAFWRSGGVVASGAAAYLCGTVPAGQETSGQRPWDYPSENFEIEGSWAFAACHLVGNQLGGGVEPGNLVTCHHPTTNNRDMKGLENAIAASVTSDNHILYVVTPYYNGTPEEDGRPNPLSGIRVTAISLGAQSLWLDVCFTNGWNGGHVPGPGCA